VIHAHFEKWIESRSELSSCREGECAQDIKSVLNQRVVAIDIVCCATIAERVVYNV
jgi:hypothetical protein